MRKIFLPYVFWSAIYYFFIYKDHSGTFIDSLLYGSSSWQLYFIPALFIFYLLFPLVHKFYDILSNKFIIGILFVLEIYLLNHDYQFHSSPYPYPIGVFLFNYFVFLVGVIGARNQKYLIKFLDRYKFIFAIFSIVLGFYVFYEGRSNYLASYNYLAFYSQWRPSILLYTIILAGILYFLFSKLNYKYIKLLSNLSYFVFFIHIIFLELLWQKVGLNLVHYFWFDIFFFIAVSFLSFLTAYIIHKIPYLLKFTG